jgi:hypothetical protein
MTPTALAQLNVVYLGPNNWRVLEGQNNHRVDHVGDGLYRCTCPMRGDCAHIQVVKDRPTDEGGQQGAVLPPSLGGAKTLPPPPSVLERIERLRNDLMPLLYGFKEEYQSFGFATEIERLRMELSHVMRMGFGSDICKVFVNNKGSGCWNMMDGDTAIPIKGNGLWGMIAGIEVKARQPGSTPTHHLYCDIDADRRYRLVSGYGTHFSKGFLATVAKMTTEQLRSPVWIQPKQETKMIYCNIHQNGQLIRARYDKDIVLRDVAIQAMRNLAIAQAV